MQFRGRQLSESDLTSIREVVQAHPRASRREISRQVCQRWHWVQPNGRPCDFVCRSMLLALDRAGHITLPPPKGRHPNPLATRRRPPLPVIDTTPIAGPLQELGPLEFRLVRRTPQEPLFNGLMEHHHYLGYTQPVGEHLKYIVYAREHPIACLAWSSAPRHLRPRDQFIGWGPEARRHNLRFIAYNTRYLIMPWVRVPRLASHILGRMATLVPRDWARIYGHAIHYLETFIDLQRSRGTCYRAANWIVLGLTSGRGHNATSHQRNGPPKQVLGYPLEAQFRQRLTALPGRPAGAAQAGAQTTPA
jgi:hypothetical protein